MSQKANYLKNEERKHWFRTGNATALAALHVHLLKTLPSDDDGTGAAVIAMTGYSPIQRDPLDANWGAPANGHADNVAEFDFGTWTGTSERVIGIALGDSATFGSMNWLYWGPLANNYRGFVAKASDDVFTAIAHGLADDDRVFLRGENLPTGAGNTTEYYVVSSTADTFKISLTQGGAAVNITADGWGEVGDSKARTVLSGDGVKIPANDLDVFNR